MPNWVNSLFKLRNFLVKFVGLDGDKGRNNKDLRNCIRNGGEYGAISAPKKLQRVYFHQHPLPS